MIGRVLPGLFLGLALCLAGPLGASAPASAQACLSPGQARQAAQSGQIMPLSRVLNQIRKAGQGEIVPPPQLCNIGGRYVYVVNVLSKNGQVTQLTVDAAT